jgi:hypothetical protein
VLARLDRVAGAIEMREYSPISKVLSTKRAIPPPSKVTSPLDIRHYIGVYVSKAMAAADRLDWAVFDGKTIVLQTQ